MADFTVRLGDLTEVTCDNLAAALHTAHMMRLPAVERMRLYMSSLESQPRRARAQ